MLHQISEFLKEVDVRNQLRIPVRINDMYDKIEVTTETCVTLFTCNHEEADTVMIYHALRQDIPIVIVSKDTDVLVLMIYAFSKHRPSSEWYMKISDKRFIKNSTIVNYLGLSTSLVLPQYHVITGCDTTSYFYGIGKIKPLKKLMQAESKVSYTTRLVESSDIPASLIRDTVNFIKEICYNGSEIESLVDVRVKIYRSMKTKSSQSLPPDPKS